jgi:hypothetical protein
VNNNKHLSFRNARYWPSALFMVLFAPFLVFGQQKHTAEVRPHQGRPALWVDGQPQSPQIYALTHAYGGRWSWEERPARNLANFYALGVRVFQVDLHFEDIWQKNKEKLDLDLAKRQIQGVLDACPDAAVIVRVHVNAPFWWNEAHPEEWAAYANGPHDSRRYGPPFNHEDGDVGRARRASLASERWRTEAGARLRELCRRLAKTRQGKAVIGIHVAGGVYGEWHNWGFIEHEPDTGPAMTHYFRQWLRQKYGSDQRLQTAWQTDRFTLDNATAIDTAERNRTGDGMFRDPLTEQRTIDFYRAQQQVVVEDIAHFCRIVKQNWPRPLVVGVFYGYYHSTFSKQAAGGHLLVQEVLDNPDIDYLAGPQSYYDPSRKLGGSGLSRSLLESIRLHDKLWLDEVDNGALQVNRARDFVRSDELQDTNYLQILRRSLAFPVLRGAGYWLYDFGPQRSTGWWDSPFYLDSLRAWMDTLRTEQERPYQSAADVLFVYDTESYYYAKNRKTAISQSIPDLSMEDALRSGAVADHVFLFDLPKLDLAPYKAVFFVNCFVIDTAMRHFIQEKIACCGRTVIWNYLPGYVHPKGNSIENVQNLTGFTLEKRTSAPKPAVRTAWGQYKFDFPLQPMFVLGDTAQLEVLARVADSTHAPVVARAGRDGYSSVMAAMPLQSSTLFRSIFAAAGCHIYNEQNDFLYANGRWVLLHTAAAGPREIHLRSGKKVKLELKRASTVLLRND